MPINRIAALFRAAADYRVEACFLAALAFTLGHDAFHHSEVELHTTMTRDNGTIVHEITPVRVAEARRATHVRHQKVVGIAVPAPLPHGGSDGTDRRIVIKRGSDAAVPCATSFAPDGVTEGATCKVIRATPVVPSVVLAKARAGGG